MHGLRGTALKTLLLDSDLGLTSSTRPHSKLLLRLVLLNLVLLLQCDVLELNLKLELQWVLWYLGLRSDNGWVVTLPLLVEVVQGLMVHLTFVY